MTFDTLLDETHRKAFTVAATVSPAYLTKLRELLCLAMEMGASVHEWRTAVQHLNDTTEITP